MYSFANASADECNNGDARACFSEAKTYDNNKDDKKALEFYNKACGLDYAIGCNKAGEKYLAKKDNENAKKLYSKACDLNHHESCVSYGEIYENEGDCDKAGEIYKDAFKNKKFKPASDKFEALVGNEKCMQIPPQQATIQQPVKEKNNGELQAFLDNVSLCDSKHDGKACMEVGVAYKDGIKGHIKADPVKANRYLTTACELKNIDGCNMIVKYIREVLNKDEIDIRTDDIKKIGDSDTYKQIVYVSILQRACITANNVEYCAEGANYAYEQKMLKEAYVCLSLACSHHNRYCGNSSHLLFEAYDIMDYYNSLNEQKSKKNSSKKRK